MAPTRDEEASETGDSDEDGDFSNEEDGMNFDDAESANSSSSSTDKHSAESSDDGREAETIWKARGFILPRLVQCTASLATIISNVLALDEEALDYIRPRPTQALSDRLTLWGPGAPYSVFVRCARFPAPT